MNKKNLVHPVLSLIALIALTVMLVMPNPAFSAGPTTYAWPSFRHDLLNTGATTDSVNTYPTTNTVLWSVYRSDRPDVPGTPAGSRGPVVVDKGMVYTAGTGIIQANDQFTGAPGWSKAFPSILTTLEPVDAPADWCYNDIPRLEGNTGACYVADMVNCPSWCFECTTELPDCSDWSLINPLGIGGEGGSEGYGQFLTGPTLDTANNCIIFGTFDGRVISLNMDNGATNWERTPFKDPGGPNYSSGCTNTRIWYDQKFAWHLSPPAIANGKVYIGSFLPSFYAIFRPWAYTSDPYPWPTIGNDATHYWAGRDGYFYGLNESDGTIAWTWDPRGCGVTNVPPVYDGKVFLNADTVTDYHYGQFATVDANNGAEIWHVGTIPLAQGGSQSISGDTIFTPGGDGALWALDVNTGQVKWTYHAGFSVMGHTALSSSTAVDETQGWVLGVADTGHMFVLNKNTGRVVKEAFLGVPGWNVFDPHPDSGYWFPGPGSMAIVPEQGLLYIAATDYDRAWQGMFNKGREKLFCYDYGSDPNKLILKWEYQFCNDDDLCAAPSNEYLVRGHDPYVVAWYSLGTPALADGHVYYASDNGKVYCFGSAYTP